MSEPQAEQMGLERQSHQTELEALQRQIRAVRGKPWKVNVNDLSDTELMAVVDYERQRLRMLRVVRH